MKVVKLYMKKNVPPDQRKIYIRSSEDSLHIGNAIINMKGESDEDYIYDLLKRKTDIFWSRYSRKYTNAAGFSFGNLDLRIVSTADSVLAGWVNPEGTMQDPSFYEEIRQDAETIYTYLTERNEHNWATSFESRAADVVHVFLLAGVGQADIASCIKNNAVPVATIDGDETIFFRVIENGYYDGEHYDRFLISYEGAENRSRCDQCDHVDYCEDTDSIVYVERSDEAVCETCYQDYYRGCESCGDTYHEEDDGIHWHESRSAWYCDHCWQDHGSCIQSYDYTPHIYFYDYKGGKFINTTPAKTKLPFYGCELEVEVFGGDKESYAEEISHYSSYEEYCYCKNDGSLSNGFEVCFMPMTYQAVQKFNFEDAVLRFRGRSGLQSYNTDNCGIHIHINREAFTDHHLFKFISFIHEFKSLMYLISQRKAVSELNSYAKFNNAWKDRAKKEMTRVIKSKKATLQQGTNSERSQLKLYSTTTYGDKYVPVNLRHRSTIEVRIFKGNLAEIGFRKNFEFVDALYYFTRDNPIYKLQAKRFIQYCTDEKKRYRNLNNFFATNNDRLEKVLQFPLAVPEGLAY